LQASVRKKATRMTDLIPKYALGIVMKIETNTPTIRKAEYVHHAIAKMRLVLGVQFLNTPRIALKQ